MQEHLGNLHSVIVIQNVVAMRFSYLEPCLRLLNSRSVAIYLRATHHFSAGIWGPKGDPRIATQRCMRLRRMRISSNEYGRTAAMMTDETWRHLTASDAEATQACSNALFLAVCPALGRSAKGLSFVHASESCAYNSRALETSVMVQSDSRTAAMMCTLWTDLRKVYGRSIVGSASLS
jgi:hypothetical protein